MVGDCPVYLRNGAQRARREGPGMGHLGKKVMGAMWCLWAAGAVALVFEASESQRFLPQAGSS